MAVRSGIIVPTELSEMTLRQYIGLIEIGRIMDKSTSFFKEVEDNQQMVRHLADYCGLSPAQVNILSVDTLNKIQLALQKAFASLKIQVIPKRSFTSKNLSRKWWEIWKKRKVTYTAASQMRLEPTLVVTSLLGIAESMSKDVPYGAPTQIPKALAYLFIAQNEPRWISIGSSVEYNNAMLLRKQEIFLDLNAVDALSALSFFLHSWKSYTQQSAGATNPPSGST